MQFVKGGPHVPDALLDAHEEGRVILFCGAGISCPAGLPGFGGLINEIYTALGIDQTSTEERAYSGEQYDTVLHLLEQRYLEGRLGVRTPLVEILKPRLRRKGATRTHQALLQLARTREGALRLVTTNFDRIFERLKVRKKIAAPAYSAPLLPIPKDSRWDGIVYLHGLLPDRVDEAALNRLVLTSGDFGLAYLTERWAARFVSELFRNYIICFVGYGINDPVMRYMMDALAADRRLGEPGSQAYAFGVYETGQEANQAAAWEAKGVTPILYHSGPDRAGKHSGLHETLDKWAGAYRDGIQGKERIVAEHAMTRPAASTAEDDFVGRMLWALSDKSGLPAKQFADLNPAPPLEWLKVLSGPCFGSQDLSRFEVPASEKRREEPAFSLLSRPAPYTQSLAMSVASAGGSSGWDPRMNHLARWLIRHLNDPELILWVIEQGGVLDNRFAQQIKDQLRRFAQWKAEDPTERLAAVRLHAPNAVPEPQMQTFWQLFLGGLVRSSEPGPNFPFWTERLKREGLTVFLRLELRVLLAPKVALTRSFSWRDSLCQPDDAGALKKPVDAELVIATDNTQFWLKELRKTEAWSEWLPALVEDFQQLLGDAMGLLRALGQADDRHDDGYLHLPSISPHWQNRGFRDWVALIECLRDAWLAVYEKNREQARCLAQSWVTRPYPTFRRLALFAATYDEIAPNGEWVDWLLVDGSLWLWADETWRETMRLLVLKGTHLPPRVRKKLEAAIVAGPSSELFPELAGSAGYPRWADGAVSVRLTKLKSGGIALGRKGEARLAVLFATYPNWRPADDERDEFPHWMTATGDPGHQDPRQVDIAPLEMDSLVEWLRGDLTERAKTLLYSDNWYETCAADVSLSVAALSRLAEQNEWPVRRWEAALQAWTQGSLARPSWLSLAPLVRTMPDAVLVGLIVGLVRWLEVVAKSLDSHETVFFELCDRVLVAGCLDTTDMGRRLDTAMNHPVGHVTQALLNVWFGSKPHDDQGLRGSLKARFSRLCDTENVRYVSARTILAANLIAFFRVDRAWTESCLLPLFNWTTSPLEAQAAWDGFLWSPRVYPPLLSAFKTDFLTTAAHYDDLEEHQGRQYVTLLIYAALDPVDLFNKNEVRTAMAALPQAGLVESAQALVNALQSMGKQRETYWINRIRPFWNSAWPKFSNPISPDLAEPLARLAIAAGDAFPNVVSAMRPFFVPLKNLMLVVPLLKGSGLCARYPKDALTLLARTIDGLHWIPPEEIEACMRDILNAAPELVRTRDYQNLRRHSGR
ncbi:MAG: anti-phage defense-associated sirtuin Dsr1 [Acidiferrobacter sp.]